LPVKSTSPGGAQLTVGRLAEKVSGNLSQFCAGLLHYTNHWLRQRLIHAGVISRELLGLKFSSTGPERSHPGSSRHQTVEFSRDYRATNYFVAAKDGGGLTIDKATRADGHLGQPRRTFTYRGMNALGAIQLGTQFTDRAGSFGLSTSGRPGTVLSAGALGQTLSVTSHAHRPRLTTKVGDQHLPVINVPGTQPTEPSRGRQVLDLRSYCGPGLHLPQSWLRQPRGRWTGRASSPGKPRGLSL